MIRALTLALAAACTSVPSAVLDTTAGGPPGGATGWSLTFSDEFAGSALDGAKWQTTWENGGRSQGWTPRTWFPDNNVSVAGGSLRLRATGNAVDSYQYTGGVAATWNSFSQAYGFFEARMKCPRGEGLWSAFWMLEGNDTWPPEIDIVEFKDHEWPMYAYQTWHYQDWEHQDQFEVNGGARRGTWTSTAPMAGSPAGTISSDATGNRAASISTPTAF